MANDARHGDGAELQRSVSLSAANADVWTTATSGATEANGSSVPTRRRRSTPSYQRADRLMEKAMNPYLDREAWAPYEPQSELQTSAADPDTDAQAAAAAVRRKQTQHTQHTQQTNATAKATAYIKATAFDDGLHSTYVAQYPTGLRGLFVLVQSPLLLLAIGLFSGSVGIAIDLWGVQVAEYHRWLSALGFGPFLLSALLTGGFSTALVHLVCPQAAGSGLPFMRVAISGIDMSAFLSLRCVATKIVGLLAALAAGLSIGKEGPFIMISCGFASILMDSRAFRRIRDDETKRLEMLACACSAGVAATFGSPFGGVLFGVEVTSHFYLVRTLPRSLFAAIVGALLVNFGAANTTYGLFGSRSLGLSADTAVGAENGPTLSELAVFAAMGVVCGLGGAVFNYTLSWLVRVRDLFFQRSSQSARASWWDSLGKRLALVLTVTLLSCWLEFYGDSAWFIRHGSPRRILAALFSKNKQVFSDGSADVDAEDDSLLLSRSLVTFLPLKFLLTLVSIVLPVPAGLFTPTFVIGGIFGRLVGESVRAFGLLQTHYAPFEFAIVGAGAFSSGVTHAVSTAVIIMEVSHTDGLNLPVSVAILAAYFTAKRFTENVYDVLIMTSHLPRLRKLPKAAYDIPVWEVMKDVAHMGVLTADSTYKEALDVLRGADMEAVFPVVDSLQNRFLLATVTRARLAAAVAHCQRQSATAIALTSHTPSNSDAVASAATSLLFPTTPRSATPTAMRAHGYTDRLRPPTPVVRSLYGATDLATPTDAIAWQDSVSVDVERGANTPAETLPVDLLDCPIHFAFCRGGKIMDWGTNELCARSQLTVLVDPSPFQLMEMTPMRRVDQLFRMLKLNNVYVARSGRLVGVISLERLMAFLGTTTPYEAPGLLQTLENSCRGSQRRQRSSS